MSRSYKSVYETVHPEKYVGDNKRIMCRSSWERWFCTYLDHNDAVVKWASEEIFIPYISPNDGRQHRYFVDFLVKFKDGKMILVEVKPFYQTQHPPIPNKKSHKAMSRFEDELKTFMVNKAKWEAASRFALENGMTFHVFTENELRALGAPL
jgi:hypothetical protein